MVRSVAAGQFKHGCLALLDEVADKGIELVITKRGKVVARILPPTTDAEREAQVLRELRQRGRISGTEADLLAPSSRVARWAEPTLPKTKARPSR